MTGLLLALTAMILGGFAGVALLLGLADTSFLTPMVPDDGRNAVVVGGIALGCITGGFVPTLLMGMAHGSEDKPRIRPGTAGKNLLAVLVFDVYVVILAFILAQLGWILPERPVTLVSVLCIGFSWAPLALMPWKKLGLRSVIGKSVTPRSSSGSHQSK
ncbi:hypothetical protein ABT124_09640 [Streptomyces sp. NPDC001982]|uniref:hypothetical protein n=1 Tax=unclassified Streptomyces TaxID=2593676 RepID=UPI0033213DFA